MEYLQISAIDASPAYKDVGEYTVYFKITKQGYAPITGSRTVEITPQLSQ